MKTKIIILALLFIFLPVNLNFLVPASVQAQAVSDTSIVIQPSKTEVTASLDQKLARSFSIINRSNFSVNLKLVVKDYKQISSDGKLQFFDAAKEPAATWIIPQYVQIGLRPLETKQISFVVSVPKDFSSGGHYGAILFEPVGGNANNINMSNFGELVLLTATSNTMKTTAIVKSVNFWTGMFQQGNPVDFNFTMQNTGNTHFDAQAKLVLTNWLGKEIGNYNIGSLTVYPKTSRLFQWRWSGTPMFGIYKADVLIANGALNNKFTSVDGKWFILFPWPIASIIFLASVLVFAAVKYRKNILAFRLSKWIKIERKISAPLKRNV
jgi:hypothetical protein